MKNILEFLQITAARLPDKTAVIDEAGQCSWHELLQYSQSAGTALAARLAPRTPVPVLMEKGRHALYAFSARCRQAAFMCR